MDLEVLTKKILQAPIDLIFWSMMPSMVSGAIHLVQMVFLKDSMYGDLREQ